MAPPRYLFIVARDHSALFDYLQERFAVESNVAVVLDRRLRQRRVQDVAVPVERRRMDRRIRPDVEEELRLRSHVVVNISS